MQAGILARSLPCAPLQNENITWPQTSTRQLQIWNKVPCRNTAVRECSKSCGLSCGCGETINIPTKKIPSSDRESLLPIILFVMMSSTFSKDDYLRAADEIDLPFSLRDLVFTTSGLSVAASMFAGHNKAWQCLGIERCLLFSTLE